VFLNITVTSTNYLERFVYLSFALMPISDMLQSLDRLLTRHISDKMSIKMKDCHTLSQIAQIIATFEYFEAACGEIEQNLASLR
jgi:hypothetical protein